MKITILRDQRRNKLSTKQIGELSDTEVRIREQFTIVEAHEAEVFLVLGGDGSMVRYAKEMAHHKKMYYGVNKGTFGFLLNDHENSDDLLHAVSNAEVVSFPLLETTIQFIDGSKSKAFAFNDVFTKTATAQGAKHYIKIDGMNIFGTMQNGDRAYYSGDGVIICTPGGSTAYNRAAGGLIIDHDATSFGLTPVSPFIPADFRPQLISKDSTVVIEMIEDAKRQHLVVADNQIFRNVHKVTIKRSETVVSLGFKPDNSYLEKTMKLRFPWL